MSSFAGVDSRLTVTEVATSEPDSKVGDGEVDGDKRPTLAREFYHTFDKLTQEKLMESFDEAIFTNHGVVFKHSILIDKSGRPWVVMACDETRQRPCSNWCLLDGQDILSKLQDPDSNSHKGRKKSLTVGQKLGGVHCTECKNGGLYQRTAGSSD
jgi:hypothetical protein